MKEIKLLHGRVIIDSKWGGSIGNHTEEMRLSTLNPILLYTLTRGKVGGTLNCGSGGNYHPMGANQKVPCITKNVDAWTQ